MENNKPKMLETPEEVQEFIDLIQTKAIKPTLFGMVKSGVGTTTSALVSITISTWLSVVATQHSLEFVKLFPNISLFTFPELAVITSIIFLTFFHVLTPLFFVGLSQYGVLLENYRTLRRTLAELYHYKKVLENEQQN